MLHRSMYTNLLIECLALFLGSLIRQQNDLASCNAMLIEVDRLVYAESWVGVSILIA